MSSVKRPCKVCGKEFTPCFDCIIDTINNGTFHWRGVVCSKECAKIYLRRISLGLATNSDESEKEYYKNFKKTKKEKNVTTNINNKE